MLTLDEILVRLQGVASFLIRLAALRLVLLWLLLHRLMVRLRSVSSAYSLGLLLVNVFFGVFGDCGGLSGDAGGASVHGWHPCSGMFLGVGHRHHGSCGGRACRRARTGDRTCARGSRETRSTSS